MKSFCLIWHLRKLLQSKSVEVLWYFPASHCSAGSTRGRCGIAAAMKLQPSVAHPTGHSWCAHRENSAVHLSFTSFILSFYNFWNKSKFLNVNSNTIPLLKPQKSVKERKKWHISVMLSQIKTTFILKYPEVSLPAQASNPPFPCQRGINFMIHVQAALLTIWHRELVRLLLSNSWGNGVRPEPLHWSVLGCFLLCFWSFRTTGIQHWLKNSPSSIDKPKHNQGQGELRTSWL